MDDGSDAVTAGMGGSGYVDTHVHLDDPAFDVDRAEVLSTARAADVGRFINIGYCPERWGTTIALARSEQDVSFTLGLHPGHADEDTPETFATLVGLVGQHRPAAIGEIGLDYSRPAPDADRQRDLFRRQLDLAAETGLPVVIHQRGAAADCAEILATTAPGRVVILHCFDGSDDLLRLGLGRGWLFGIGGLVTRPKNVTARAALSHIPLAQVVLETDSPYLVPAGTKGRRNSPAAIPRVAAEVAALMGQPVDRVQHVTTATAERVFGPWIANGRRDD